jgi:ankyrin repeat protein
MRTALLCLLVLPLWGAPEDVFSAIRNDHLAGLQKADLSVHDRRGNTPLMYAAAFGSVEAVRQLIAAAADVNARNGFGATPLIWAAGNPEKARLLVEHGADVNAHTQQGRTALMVAAACDGCSGVVRLLLAKGADAKVVDSGSETALSLAAEAGDLESVRLLLNAGAEANETDRGGVTPLERSVFNCNLAAVKLLLAKGAKVNTKVTFAGKVKFGDIQLIGLTPLLNATAYCRAEMVDALLEAGADVNAKDIRGMTALMLGVASETQDAAIVRRLVHAGADVNAKSTAGESVLDWAKKYGDRDVISILTAEGAHEAANHAAPKRPGGAPKTAAAVDSAVGLLQGAAAEFFHQSGCVGCHHQPMTVMASAAAHRNEGAAELRKVIATEFTSAQDRLLQRFDPGGGSDGEGYSMLALAAAGYAPDAMTDTVAVHTAAMQRQAGNWHVGDVSRSPIQESEIARTARGMRTLQVYGPPALQAEFAPRIERARDFIVEAHAKTNDDFAMQLVGAHWGGTAPEKVQSLGAALRAKQRADGGWGQNANLASDAYATGESLWALRESGVMVPSDAAYRRGVQYLLATQWPDGSWYVRSRAPKFQPYFQSGFPFDHDQWVSSAATAWAVMALAPAIEEKK